MRGRFLHGPSTFGGLERRTTTSNVRARIGSDQIISPFPPPHRPSRVITTWPDGQVSWCRVTVVISTPDVSKAIFNGLHFRIFPLSHDLTSSLISYHLEQIQPTNWRVKNIRQQRPEYPLIQSDGDDATSTSLYKAIIRRKKSTKGNAIGNVIEWS